MKPPIEYNGRQQGFHMFEVVINLESSMGFHRYVETDSQVGKYTNYVMKDMRWGRAGLEGGGA